MFEVMYQFLTKQSALFQHIIFTLVNPELNPTLPPKIPKQMCKIGHSQSLFLVFVSIQ